MHCLKTDVEDLRNRLLKMKKHLGKWARRNSVYCYRVYEKDLPAYPFIADLYEDHLILTEIVNSSIRQRKDFSHWKSQVIELFCEVFEIAEDHLHLKERFKRSGGVQYEKLDSGKPIQVREDIFRFQVFPDDWVDVGLFLDHRPLRKKIKEISQNKNVLNLFCYTGSFSIYAAGGGAAKITSVDTSARYLEIAKENFRLNDLQISDQVTFLREDAREYLDREDSETYDIIICDAPVFSKGKKLQRDFDITRDHPNLIIACVRLLTKGGCLFFSTNMRKFKIQLQSNEAYSIKEITASTIPEDFRNSKIHVCYEIRKN